ncbi:uncharacterized protein I303_100591 [Kwoniella dejecticola CBS 10117]|uniref:Cyclase n=1 Tax=Kwoniella dejecticola CBS 10117 TaxID=1296121 RepID=A0A1A6AFC5_9TREE|nr:uncharacterized protein I303_00594 [Kwoniella dejecticola CBS 10117]OBR88777.1 hypothetical protein I303_00594 [Kwoniella dejecticola CBS 10117]
MPSPSSSSSATPADTGDKASDPSLLSLSHLTPSSDPSHPFSSWPSITPNPIGRLVLLTPEVTRNAISQCVQTGKRFSLDWSVYPSGARMYGRACGQHTIKRVDQGPSTKSEAESRNTGDRENADLAEIKKNTFHPCFDDFIEINTQSSTQWDYFLHYSYPHSGLFFGGLTEEQIRTEDTGDFGVAAIARAGGVQTRAILLDIPLYLSQKNLPPNPPLANPPPTKLTFDVFQDVLAHFNIQPRVGDMLIVRTGFEDAVIESNSTGEEIKASWWGVEQCSEIIEWIWENGIVTVGTDNPTFENWPVSPNELQLHPVLLSGMGIMICELMRLNEIAEECKKLNRWEFFFSSNPLMIEHGVASPPNAVAIF